MLPGSVMDGLKDYLQGVKRLYQQDLDRGYGSVYLPFTLERKYPNADRAWIWQFVFPSARFSHDPHSDITPHHLHESGLHQVIK